MADATHPFLAGLLDDLAPDLAPDGALDGALDGGGDLHGRTTAVAGASTTAAALGCVVVADRDLPLLRGSSVPLDAEVSGGAAQLAGPVGLARRTGLDLRRLTTSLADPHDLAANARRVVAAVDALAGEHDLDDLAVVVAVPSGPDEPGGPRAGWLAALDELAARELPLLLTDDRGTPGADLAARLDAALDRELPVVLRSRGGDGGRALALLVAQRLVLDGELGDAAAVLDGRASALGAARELGADALGRARRLLLGVGVPGAPAAAADLVAAAAHLPAEGAA